MLNAPHHGYERLDVLEQIALRLLRVIDPRMLVIDEVHNLLAGTPREQRRMLNLLKFLANQLRVPLVCVGTDDALRAMQSDPQIASRFEPFLRAPARAIAWPLWQRVLNQARTVSVGRNPSSKSLTY